MSEGKDCLKSGVIRKIERIVCDCVNKAFCNDKYVPVSPLSLYEGRTNIPFVKRMARPAVFVIAHDRFGVPYSALERHSHIHARNIIRSVRMYKDIPCSDSDVKRINELIEVELKKFPIV